jgi:hypothetical protein
VAETSHVSFPDWYLGLQEGKCALICVGAARSSEGNRRQVSASLTFLKGLYLGLISNMSQREPSDL